MPSELVLFIIILSFIWFVAYWILGGVFFAVIALLKLQRLRKVRFSCLFSAAALVCAIGASVIGVQWAQSSMVQCLAAVGPEADGFVATFTCGFFGIMGAFLLGAAVLVLTGFVVMAISKRKGRWWLTSLIEGRESSSEEPEDGEETSYETSNEPPEGTAEENENE